MGSLTAAPATVPMGSSKKMSERAKYIPLRLSYEERKFLRLVEASLSVCEYTERYVTITLLGERRCGGAGR